jgi:hypothetical protein
MSMNLKKEISTKLILMGAIVIGISAGVTAHMVKPLEKDQDKGNASIRIADEDKDKINQKAIPGAVESAPAAPVAAEVPAETTTSPTAEPEARVEPETQPQTHKWSAEMTAAGIASADHSFAGDMVLEDYGWRMVMREKPVWHLARQTQGSLTEQLVQVNKYVEVRHSGSWAAAHAQYVSTGNF